RSDDGGRGRFTGDARGPERRRARRADRLRRAARHRADHRPNAARRLSDLRIPARARHGGSGRRAARAEGDDRRGDFLDDVRRMTYAETLEWLYHLEVSRGWDLKLESGRGALARLRCWQHALAGLVSAGLN